MNLCKMIKRFAVAQDGAVTVDWVVLTAAIVGLGVAMLSTIGGGIDSASSAVNDALTSAITQ